MGVNKYVALAVGVPLGAYVGSVGLSVYQSEREVRKLEETVLGELKQEQQAQQAARREEAAIHGIQETVSLHQKGIEQIDAEIGVVEQRLADLKEMREVRLKEAADAAGALQEAQAKLSKIVQEARRHQQALTAAEQALAEARLHSREAKDMLYNPLQHPLVKGFSGRQ